MLFIHQMVLLFTSRYFHCALFCLHVFHSIVLWIEFFNSFIYQIAVIFFFQRRCIIIFVSFQQIYLSRSAMFVAEQMKKWFVIKITEKKNQNMASHQYGIKYVSQILTESNETRSDIYVLVLLCWFFNLARLCVACVLFMKRDEKNHEK